MAAPRVREIRFKCTSTAAVAERMPAQSCKVRAGDLEVPIVQLVLEFAQQTLKPAASPNWLAQRLRIQRCQIDRDCFFHAEHHTDAP